MHCVGGRFRGIFSFLGKRISPFDPQEKGILIASEQLEEVRCLPIALPIARRCRVSIARRFASAPTIRCRSASLAAGRPNHRLPVHPSMRRFRTQSAAGLPSLAPHDSKARLLSGRDSQGFMAKPCTPHLHCAARAVIQAQSCQCAGSRGKAPCVLLGDLKGAILSRERMAPFAAPLRVRREKRSAAALHHAQRNASTASPSAQRYSRPPLA